MTGWDVDGISAVATEPGRAARGPCGTLLEHAGALGEELGWGGSIVSPGDRSQRINQ